MSVTTEEMFRNAEQRKQDMQVKQDEASARRDMAAKRVREQIQEGQTRAANQKQWQANRQGANAQHQSQQQAAQAQHQKTQQLAQHHQRTQTAIERHRASQIASQQRTNQKAPQQRANQMAPSPQFKQGPIKAINPTQPKVEPKKEAAPKTPTRYGDEPPAVRMARAIERVERGPQLKPVPEKPKDKEETRERGYSR